MGMGWFHRAAATDNAYKRGSLVQILCFPCCKHSIKNYICNNLCKIFLFKLSTFSQNRTFTNKLCGMKVYAVIVEPEYWDEDLVYEIIGIYQNEEDANDKLADIMQEIEAYAKTYIGSTGNEEEDEKNWRIYNDNFPHKIGNQRVDVCYVKEFDLL
jgi:hypothetical protein